MDFCVGTIGFPHDPEGDGPRGTLHAVRAAEAYGGASLCGARVQAWTTLTFPTLEPDAECEICRYATDKETGPATAA